MDPDLHDRRADSASMRKALAAPTTGAPGEPEDRPTDDCWRHSAEPRSRCPPTSRPSSIKPGRQGKRLGEAEVVRLFGARGDDFTRRRAARPIELRQKTNGDTVSYVVNRNINYTNICYFKCQFCAFSKGKLSENLRGRPYDLATRRFQRRVHGGGLGPRRHRSLHAGRHPSRVHGARPTSDILKAVKKRCPTCTCTPFHRWRSGRAPPPSSKDLERLS